MTQFYYNDYNGPETIHKEYKLFTLHPMGSSLDINDESYAEKLFIDGTWIYNDSVIQNLNFYLETYLPKYTTAFLNSSSHTDKGEMYFGISDDGIIHGIPYKGELNKNKILDKVKEILNSDKLKTNANLKDLIDIEIIRINTTNYDKICNHNYIIENYFVQKKIYKALMNKFIKRRKKWINIMEHYSDKLYCLINNKNTRQELINYIIIKDPSKKKIIRLLKSNYVFPEKSGEEINILKNDKNDVWYWLTTWKDDMTDFVKSFKPKPPQGISNSLYPHNVITTLVEMIPKWISNNRDLNLFLIKFTFQKPKNDIIISYKGNFGEYTDCYRCLIEGEPCCMPIGF